MLAGRPSPCSTSGVFGDLTGFTLRCHASSCYAQQASFKEMPFGACTTLSTLANLLGALPTNEQA